MINQYADTELWTAKDGHSNGISQDENLIDFLVCIIPDSYVTQSNDFVYTQYRHG